MKIGFFSDTLEKKGSGIGSYTKYILKYLKKITKGGDTIHTIDWIKRDEYNEHIKIPNPFPFYKEYLWHSYCIIKLRKMDFDIIHNPSQIPIFIKPYNNYIMTIHDITPIIEGESHVLSLRLNYLLAMKKTLKHSSAIIADSIATKKDIIHFFNIPDDHIEVIYLAADDNFGIISSKDIENFKNSYGIHYPYILFVGMIEPRKNLDTLIKAFYLLKKKGYPHKLVIAGKAGWKNKKIFKLIDNLNLQKEIVFTGFVTENLLPALYNGAEFFVYPSLYEGFGLPPLEAMKCGCPVITSNISSLPEIVDRAGILVDPKDEANLIKNMEEMICDDTLREEYRKKGLQRAKVFDWETCAKKTYNVYQQVYQKSKPEGKNDN